MKYQVFIINEAEKDILDICNYVQANDSPVLNRIEEICGFLRKLPLRGHFVPELERIGVLEYREVHFKPYRVIYQITGNKVFVHCVLDARRDLQGLLERRFLR